MAHIAAHRRRVMKIVTDAYGTVQLKKQEGKKRIVQTSSTGCKIQKRLKLTKKKFDTFSVQFNIDTNVVIMSN